ncbi:MAG: glycosyltransferase family 87 protein [Zavarzinella sp.]
MVSARQAHLLFFFVLIGIFIYTGIRYTKKVLTPRRDGYTQSAILRWSKQIQAMEDGENIHETNNYPNPPIMAQLLWPFSEIATGNAFGKYSPAVAALLWFFLKIGMAWLCIDWAFKMVEDPEHPMPVWAKFLAIGLSLRPIMGDLTHGNINIFILFLVMATLMAYRKGWHITAGVVLGLAIAAKVTPALFVVYFAWKRQLLLLLSCLVGLVLFFFSDPHGVVCNS